MKNGNVYSNYIRGPHRGNPTVMHNSLHFSATESNIWALGSIHTHYREETIPNEVTEFFD
jgi:hypothetical protein